MDDEPDDDVDDVDEDDEDDEDVDSTDGDEDDDSSDGNELPGLDDIDDDLPGLAPPREAARNPAPDDRKWHVVLLRKSVRGSWHRPADDGSPMLDVYEVESVRGRLKAGAHVARVTHDVDEVDLAKKCGEGRWYVALRSVLGRIVAGRVVAIKRPADAGPVRSEPTPTALEKLLDTMLATMQRQQEELKATQDRLLAAQEKRNREELALFRQHFAAQTQPHAPTSSATQPPAPPAKDPIAFLEEAMALKARMRVALGLPEQEDAAQSSSGTGLLDDLDDIVTAVADDTDTLFDMAAKVGGIASKVGAAKSVAGLNGNGADAGE